MSKDKGRREIVFQLTMTAARKLLERGIVGEKEYRKLDALMREKYAPVFGGLFSSLDLIQCG